MVPVVGLVGVLLAGCSGADDEPENNRITRIDGPATVDDDSGADQDGAPTGPRSNGRAITDGPNRAG